MGTSRWRAYLPRTTAQQAWRVLSVNWPLGFTSFGGPPVHFKIFHDRFCDRQKWISEQVYQELFSICQALSGPASTKMLYCINLIHSGFPAAALSFLVWSLPGALAMYGLSIGVSHMGENLPREVYALLSGLNAATVGIIALAAVGLSEKAITDTVTRILVLVGAAAGMLYNALWYFPLLMITAACVTIVYDFRWLHGPYRVVAGIFKRKQRPEVGDETIELPPRNAGTGHRGGEEVATAPSTAHSSGDGQAVEGSNAPQQELPTTEAEPRIVPPEYRLNFSWKLGVATIASFLASFVVVMVLRGVLAHMPLLYNFFANMYLAGTIIFGGGPVVIPLLREYVVAEGWVSARDFLIGLAIIQALPGPNFNFAVFLGSLTAINGGYNSVGGALVGFLGIFFPGLILVHGTMGIWSALRNRRWIKSSVRGVNAAAVGLIYTAVYRLWQIGYIDEGFQSGTSLGDDPWWVVVTITSYASGRWFGASPPVAIALGAALGLIRYGVISHSGA